MKIELNYKKNILFLVAIILPTLLYVTGCSDKKNANAPILFGQYDNAKDNNMYLEIRTIDTDGESNTYYIYDDSLIEEFVNDVRNIDLQVNKSPEHITGKNDNDSSYYEKYKCYDINARIYYEESNIFCDRVAIYQSNVYLSDNDLIDYFQIDHNLSKYILEFVNRYAKSSSENIINSDNSDD